MNNNILIAYFSRADQNYFGGKIVLLPIGNTEVVMKKISEQIGGTLFKINPLKKYSEDYQICTEEAKKELNENARPPLSEYIDHLEAFNPIILGYPIYWGTMPMPVWTFLEHYDFSGKTIFPVCTHEGSGLGRSEEDIRKICPAANVRKGFAIRGSDVNRAQNEIDRWLKEQGLFHSQTD